MKRFLRIIAAVATAAAVISFSLGTFAAANVIEINGVAAEIPEGMGQIREKDNRTFVPLRFVSEFLNNDVWYDDASKLAGISSDSTVLMAQDGNRILFVVSKLTGEVVSTEMDTEAYIDPEEERMYLPIRYLAEALNYEVGWDEATQTVTLDMKQ